MPQQTNPDLEKDSERAATTQPQHAQPVEGARDRAERDSKDFGDKEEPQGKDYWRAGQEEDLNAGDEGIDDVRMDDVELGEVDKDEQRADDANEESEDLDLAKDKRKASDEDVPEEARRMDINDRTR